LKPTENVMPVRHISSSLVLNDDSYRKRPLSSKQVKDLLDNAEVEDKKEPDSLDSVWLTNPYQYRREQGNHSFRPEGDPSEYSIILFPGQGTQYVGMGKSALQLPIVKDMFDAASEILQWDLAKLCTHGPKSELNDTVKAQPAILVTSLAALEVMKEKEPERVEKCISTAGFSLGEYAALVFAGSISFEDGETLCGLCIKKLRMDMMLSRDCCYSCAPGEGTRRGHAEGIRISSRRYDDCHHGFKISIGPCLSRSCQLVY